jgi:hypothetical protein
MNSNRSTGKPSSNGGGNGSVTASTALLNRKLGTSPTPRTLTRSEIALLRHSKRETAQVAGEILATQGRRRQA